MKSVGRHFAYLSRKGDLEIETDDGRQIEGKGAEADLLEDWDLDIQEQRPTSALRAKADRKPPKLSANSPSYVPASPLIACMLRSKNA